MNEFQRWFRDRGDTTHRLNYNLGADSVVFDVGGYRGDFAAQIHRKYKSNIFIFEPVKKFYESIEKRFERTDNVRVYKYGLSDKNALSLINIDGDATSTHKQGKILEPIHVRGLDTVMEELSIEHIDLVKVNIEGEEFSLLDHWLENGLVKKMSNIQVQFHAFIEDAPRRRNVIREKLAQTHKCTYDYPFVWENWELKNAAENNEI